MHYKPGSNWKVNPTH